MMIFFGFDEVEYGWQRYFDLCNAFEVRYPPDPADAPSISTLNKWRVDSPKGFGWVIHADPGVAEALVAAYDAGSSDLPDSIWDAIERTEERAHALAAKAIIVETPPELPPSDTSRALVGTLGKEWNERTGRALIWESSGLWTVEDGRDVAADGGWVYVVDPFICHREEISVGSHGDAAFRVTERAASRRQFDSWEMEQLVNWCEPFDRAFILLSGRYKISHAKELSILLGRED